MIGHLGVLVGGIVVVGLVAYYFDKFLTKWDEEDDDYDIWG